MLSFHLHLQDLTAPWRWDDQGRRWVNGQSWIRPVCHPALESTLVHDTTRVGVVVRERHAARPPLTPSRPAPAHPMAYETLTSQMRDWPGDSVTAWMRPGTLQVTAGPYGTAPVYLTADNGVADGSWHLPDLRGHLHAGRLVNRAVTRVLCRWHRYSTDTLFAGVYRLTERAKATVTSRGVTITYPPPALHVARPRALRPGADVIAAFDWLLATTIGRIPVSAGRVGVELSGGVDSANIALALTTAAGAEVASYGVLVDGQAGHAQQQRRGALIRHFGLRDVTVPAAGHPPFVPAGARATLKPHDPAGDYYLEAFQAAYTAAAKAGIQTVFTGIGGDELLALRPEERDRPPPTDGDPPPWLGPRARGALGEVEVNTAPSASIHPSTLTAFAARNPGLLTLGLWPVSPLADPVLVRLGESLPVSWRHGKRLLRDRLGRAGLPRWVTHPPPTQREHFSGLMQTGLRDHGLGLLEGMLDGSLLADSGYVDPAALARVHEHAQSAAVIPSLLYDTIALEVGLRSLQ